MPPTTVINSRKQTRKRRAPAPRAWQRMLSGRRLDLLDPSPLDIEIDDIAHGLARVARWNGQTIGDHAFSVAQHCCVVEELVVRLSPGASATARLTALLHDAPEYVIGDMISPFKAALGYDYRTIEDRLERAIHLRFGLPAVTPGPLKKLIKAADRISAYHEAVALAGFSSEEADDIFGRPSHDMADTLDPLPAGKAQQVFLERFAALNDAVLRSAGNG